MEDQDSAVPIDNSEEFDFDLDLTDADMLLEEKFEEVTDGNNISRAAENSENKADKETASNDLEDLEGIDDIDTQYSPEILDDTAHSPSILDDFQHSPAILDDTPQSPSILDDYQELPSILDDSQHSPSVLDVSSSLSNNDQGRSVADRENSINALRDSINAFRDAVDAESKGLGDSRSAVHSNRDNIGDSIVMSETDDAKLKDRESKREFFTNTDEEKAVISDSYDAIDLTEVGHEGVEIPTADTSATRGRGDEEMNIPVITTNRRTSREEMNPCAEQLEGATPQSCRPGIPTSSDDILLNPDVPPCLSCQKAKEKKNCTHRYHPYPTSQGQGPRSPSGQGQGAARGVGRGALIEELVRMGVNPHASRGRGFSSLGIGAMRKETQSKKAKYSVEVQQVKEIFPLVHRHFVKKLLKYLGTLYNDKETLLQHAVTHLSENNYPEDGDAQWEIDAAIDKMKKVVISPPLPPRKKDPKSCAERDNFVSKWITQTDFKKAMESALATASGSDTGTSAGAGASSSAGSDSGSFGFSNPDSCSLSLGLPIPVPSGTSIRSLGTSVASIANSPGSSCGYAPFSASSGSSIASDGNDDEKPSKFVQNSFDGSPDSVKHLEAESATNTSDEKNLKSFCQAVTSESKNASNIRQSTGSYPLSGQNTTTEKSRIGKSVDLNQAGIKNSDVQEPLEMEVDFGGGLDIDSQKFYNASGRAKLIREKKQALKALARYNELEAQRNAAPRDDNKTKKDNVNNLKKENVGGKSGSTGLFTTDGALKTDVKPKILVGESTTPRFHPYSQTDKHPAVDKRSSTPEFSFAQPLASDRPDSASRIPTVSHATVSSSVLDNDLWMEETHSVVSSSTIPCDKCKTTHSVKDLGQCCDGHLLCKNCLEKAAKLILVGNKSGQVTCTVIDCGSSVPRSELRKTLHSIMLDLLDEKWNKEAVDAMNDMEDFVKCSNCGYSVILDLRMKMFKCDNCQKTFCRFCNVRWDAKDHDLCIKTKVKKTSDGTGMIAVPAHWSATSNSEEPFELVVVENTALEFTSVTELFYSTMERESFRVEKLHRIQNQRLWEKYMLMRSHMMEDLGEMHINERRLFHGTSQEVIPKICKEGFDWRLYGRNGSAFGQGTYFARDAQYSHTYSSKNGPIGLFRSGHKGQHRARLNHLLNTGLFLPSHHQGHQPFGPGPAGFTLTNLYGGGTGPQQHGFLSAFPAGSNTGQQQQLAGFPLGTSNTGFGAPPSTTSTGFSFGGPSSGSGTGNSNTGFTFGQSAGGSGFSFGNQPGFTFGSGAGAEDDMVDSTKSFMFVGRVLVGRVCRGEPNMRRPPNDESDPQKRPCHTAVDHVNRPSIFVVFESAQCYPEYLVEYAESS